MTVKDTGFARRGKRQTTPIPAPLQDPEDTPIIALDGLLCLAVWIHAHHPVVQGGQPCHELPQSPLPPAHVHHRANEARPALESPDRRAAPEDAGHTQRHRGPSARRTSRWEEALKSLRQVEEYYHRFLAKLPPMLSAADREKIRSLSGSVAALWHAPATSAADRKQIVRCLVERVIVETDKSSELNDVTIMWQGGFETRHQVARPVAIYAQLKNIRYLTERVTQLHGEGLRLAQIAERLNAEGFVPPRRRGGFSASAVGDLMRDLGLVGELFRDDLVGKDEWWITDLARELGVGPQKIHYWVRQSWVHSRRTPSGKHRIVWADKDEIRRLRQLATRKNSWTAARHPELIIPKERPKPASKKTTAGNPARSAAP